MAKDEEVENEEGDWEDGEDIVVLADAEGNEREFQFLMVIEVDGDDFALLTPVVDDGDDDAPTEVFLFRYEQDEDGGEIFSDIDDEALFARVQAAAEEALSSEDDEPAN